MNVDRSKILFGFKLGVETEEELNSFITITDPTKISVFSQKGKPVLIIRGVVYGLRTAEILPANLMSEEEEAFGDSRSNIKNFLLGKTQPNLSKLSKIASRIRATTTSFGRKRRKSSALFHETNIIPFVESLPTKN